MHTGLQYAGPPPSQGSASGPEGFAAHAGVPRGGQSHMDDEAAQKIFEELFGGGFGGFNGGGSPGCDYIVVRSLQYE